MVTQSSIVVIGHRPHELFALGQILRYQPDIFLVSRSPQRGADEEAGLLKKNLSEVGFEGEVTASRFRECELYAAMLGGQPDPFEALYWELSDWVLKRKPTVVLTDAYEHYNPIHDLCPLITSAVINRSPKVRDRVSRLLEIPLGHIALSHEALRESNWEGRRSERLNLDAESRQLKHSLLTRLLSPSTSSDGEDIADDPSLLISQWTEEQFATEIVCHWDLDRDFTQRPSIINWVTYDEHGKQRVREGKYAEALTFESHFLPIVELLSDLNRPTEESLHL